MSEPSIEINGTRLSGGQAMALRVVCGYFVDEMSSDQNFLGDDDMGRHMAAAYRERMKEVVAMLLSPPPLNQRGL